jgi:NAD(P)-dependent dehydrogenase (short-subunit alcohol dehydrogenase family)
MAYELDLNGRRALVTGGGQGIGRAISLALANAGAMVVVNDIDPQRADAVADEIVAAGGKATSLPFDVTRWADAEEAITRYGALEPIDVLVNNAGNAGAENFGALCHFAESDPQEWARYFAVNLFGTMHCTRAALPGMITAGGGGRIVTIVSESARYGDKCLAPYAAAKAGAAGFCRSVAREVGRFGITVNCVSLGTMDSPITAGAPFDGSGYVIRRRGQPEEVAGLVTYLASPQAEWITGQTYAINGGYTFSQ